MRKILDDKGRVCFLPDKGKEGLSDKDLYKIDLWSDREADRRIKYLRKKKKLQ